MLGFTTPEVHPQGSAVMSPMSWKRSVSASLAGEVFMMSEDLAECERISGVLESAIYQDYEPPLHRRKSTTWLVEPTVTVMKADSHLQIDPSTVCVPLMLRVLSRVNWRSLQTDRARIVCDQKEHANPHWRDADGHFASGWLSTL